MIVLVVRASCCQRQIAEGGVLLFSGTHIDSWRVSSMETFDVCVRVGA